MAMPMQAAENMDMNETWRSDRGMDITMPISMTMTSGSISVQSSFLACREIVLWLTGEEHRAKGVIAKRVDNLSPSKNVKADQHNVVQQQHHTSKLVRELASAAGVVCEVADIFDLWVPLEEVERNRNVSDTTSFDEDMSKGIALTIMNLCIVIEVIQKRIPAKTMVMMPGTHPNTLSDQVCAMTARQTWSPASSQEAFCQVMVRSWISCLLGGVS